MSKQALRKKNKALRQALSPEERDQYSLDIANRALDLDIWRYDYYHIFLPIERQLEIDTQYLLSILQGMDKHIIISKSDFNSMEMHNYLLTDSTKIITNNYGIPEPEGGIRIGDNQIQVVFLPLLGYDTQGNRVGYGKGFYDRFLASCSDQVVKVGVSYFEAEEKVFFTKETDVPMDYCISPKTTYSFSIT